MQLITRIIRDQQNTALVTGTRRDSGQHLLHARTGEDVAACYGCEKAIADVPGPGWLVTASPTGDECDVRGGSCGV